MANLDGEVPRRERGLCTFKAIVFSVANVKLFDTQVCEFT